MATEIDIYFLEPCVLVAEKAFQIDKLRTTDRKELLQFYFSIGSQCEISGDYLEGISKQAYKGFIRDILSYRKAVNRDDEFIEAAIDYGYSFNSANTLPDNHALNPANVGIFCSENPKDLKFALKTARQFLKCLMKSRSVPKSFMDKLFSAPADIVEEMRTFNSAYFQIALSLVHRRSRKQIESITAEQTALTIPAELVSNSIKKLDYDELLSYSKAETRKAKEFNYSTLIVLLGEEVSEWVATLLEMDIPSEDDVLRNIKNILPDPGSLPFFQTYRVELCQNVEDFFLNKYEDPEEMLHCFSELMVHPMIDILPELRNLATKSYSEKLAAEAKAEEVKKTLAEAEYTAHATEEAEELRAQISEQTKLIETLHQQIAQLEKNLHKAEKLSDDLAEKLAISQLANQRLNTLLTDSLNDELEEEDDFDEEASATGLKDRLGEETCTLLNERKVYLIGGHSSAHARITELFPHWKIAKIDDSPAFAKGNTSFDLILIVSSHCAHKQQYAAKKLAKSTGTPLAMCHKNSAFGICMGAYEALAID